MGLVKKLIWIGFGILLSHSAYAKIDVYKSIQAIEELVVKKNGTGSGIDGSIHPNDLKINKIIAEIAKIDISQSSQLSVNNQKVFSLFDKGLSLYKEMPTSKTTVFNSAQYKKLALLSKVTTDYFLSTNQPFFALAIYKADLSQAHQQDFVEREITLLSTILNLQFSLGIIDQAKVTFEKLSQIANDYFVLDGADTDGQSAYVYGIYLQNLVRFHRINPSLYHKQMRAFANDFDQITAAYQKDFKIPFISFVTTKDFLIPYSPDTIAKSNFYQNLDYLNSAADYFASVNDKERLAKALTLLKLQYEANASGDTSATSILHPNSIARKLLLTFVRQGFIRESSIDENEFKRVPLRINLEATTNYAKIYYLNGQYTLAKQYADEAARAYQKALLVYNKLSKDFYYLDNLDAINQQRLLVTAQIALALNQNAQAVSNYTKLIAMYEAYRENLPLQYRKSFFSGYSQDAYLGLIQARAQAFLTKKTDGHFNQVLEAIAMFNSREFKEITQGEDVKTPTLHGLQKSLNPQDAVVAYFDLHNVRMALSITAKSKHIQLQKIDVKQSGLLAQLKQELKTPQSLSADALLALSQAVDDGLPTNKSVRRLYILNRGDLAGLPLGLADQSGQMLNQRYTISYINTLNVPKENVGKLHDLLAVADPVYAQPEALNEVKISAMSKSRSSGLQGYFAPLPETRDEVESIAKLFPESKLLLGKEATVGVFEKQHLSQFDAIHFATHGILGGEIPDKNEPALVLGQDGLSDGLLDASKIAKLKLNAKIVVLSACNTGNGEYFRGEGLNGIARAFMVAGTQDVIATLWPVDSIATEKLMIMFYKYRMSGKNSAEALQLAKQELQKLGDTAGETRGLKVSGKKTMSSQVHFVGYQNPYYWSPFILVSN